MADEEKKETKKEEIKEEKKETENKENSERAEKQKKTHNVLLRNILIGIICLVVAFVAAFFIFQSMKEFKYKELEFQRIDWGGGLISYKTSFPIYHNGGKVNYNVYLRTDPRILAKTPFEGEGVFRENELIVINMTDPFQCEGDGVLALANLAQVMNYAYNSSLVRDPNATCDKLGRYTFVEIDKGNETKIVQTDKTCYQITIKNCEILVGIEKLILEKSAELAASAKNSDGYDKVPLI